MSFLRAFVIVCAAIFSSQSVLAQSGASAGNRAKQNVNIGLDLFGGNGSFASQGLYLGFNMGPKYLLQLGYAVGGAKTDYWQARMNYASVKLKTFFGNSFYVSAGAGYKTITAVKRLDNDVEGIEIDENNEDVYLPEKTNIAGGEIAVGNQWQHGWFTIGCDWIGLFAGSNISKKTDKEGYDDDNFVMIEHEDYKEDYEKLQNPASLLFLRFFVGASF